MNTSEKTDKILPAFAALLADVENPTKNATNPHFRNRYADLGAAIEAIRPHLSAHGLSHFQDTGSETHDGNVLPFVVTYIVHVSGQWVCSERMYLRPSKPDPQQAGSAITYARRYSLMAFLGLTAEDDDGNRGSGRKTKPRAQPKPKPAPKPVPDDDVKSCVDQATSLDELKGLFPTLPKEQQARLQPYFAARKAAIVGAMERMDA